MPPKGVPSPGSGRKRKTVITREIQQGLKESALLAEQHLKFSLRGTNDKGQRVKPLSMTRIKECELVIAHAIGTPRQKVNIYHPGEVLTLRDLAILAYRIEMIPNTPGLLTQPLDVVEGEYETTTEGIADDDSLLTEDDSQETDALQSKSRGIKKGINSKLPIEETA